MRDADRVLALLGDGGVVDDEVRVGSSEQRVRLVEKHLLDRVGIPTRRRDKVMELLDVVRRDPRRQRLHTFALSGHQKPADVDRRPLAPDLVSEGRQKRLKPLIETPLPGVRQREVAHRAPLWSALSAEWKEESGGVVLEGTLLEKLRKIEALHA